MSGCLIGGWGGKKGGVSYYLENPTICIHVSFMIFSCSPESTHLS